MFGFWGLWVGGMELVGLGVVCAEFWAGLG